MKSFTIICWLLFVTNIQSNNNNDTIVTYYGYKVLRLIPQNQSELNTIHKLQKQLDDKLDFWTEPRFLNTPVDIMIKPNELDNVIEHLQQLKISYTITIHDVQKMLDENNIFDDDSSHIDDSKSIIEQLTWTKYHRLDDINQFLEELAATYPQIVDVYSIGNSYHGRPLNVVQIGKSSFLRKPAIWIDAGIHAREWVAPATALYIIKQLVINYVSNYKLCNSIIWYILPVANPDGYEYSHSKQRMWRKTRAPSVHKHCIGTDINRNFGFHWNEGGSSSNGCSETYHGTRAFSEPESQAIANFLLANNNAIKMYLSFHSYGQMWMTPWGYTTNLPEDYPDLLALAEKATAAIAAVNGINYTLGSSTNVLYLATGGSDDWAKGVAGIKYAYTVELRDNGRYGFALPTSLILPTVEEAWEAVRVLGMEIYSLY